MLKMDCRGGMNSTHSCRPRPTTNAMFIVLLENTPIWKMLRFSLRTAKARVSSQNTSVANAMVLAVPSAMSGSDSTYSPSA